MIRKHYKKGSEKYERLMELWHAMVREKKKCSDKELTDVPLPLLNSTHINCM